MGAQSTQHDQGAHYFHHALPSRTSDESHKLHAVCTSDCRARPLKSYGVHLVEIVEYNYTGTPLFPRAAHSVECQYNLPTTISIPSLLKKSSAFLVRAEGLHRMRDDVQSTNLIHDLLTIYHAWTSGHSMHQQMILDRGCGSQCHWKIGIDTHIPERYKRGVVAVLLQVGVHHLEDKHRGQRSYQHFNVLFLLRN